MPNSNDGASATIITGIFTASLAIVAEFMQNQYPSVYEIIPYVGMTYFVGAIFWIYYSRKITRINNSHDADVAILHTNIAARDSNISSLTAEILLLKDRLAAYNNADESVHVAVDVDDYIASSSHNRSTAS